MVEAVMLYTHPECTFSDALKEELDEAGTVYTEIDLALDPDKWSELEKLTDGERITPGQQRGPFQPSSALPL